MIGTGRAEHLLVELSHEMREGRSEGERSDVLRDQLDRVLRQESADLLQALSEDLYIVEGKRSVEALAVSETIGSVLEAARRSFASGDDAATLAYLRKLPDDTPTWTPDVLSYLFGRCWERLGFPRAAAEFYDHAFAANPRPAYALMAIAALWSSGDHEVAFRRAEAIESDADAPAELTLKAATIIFNTAMLVDPAVRSTLLARVVQLAERGTGNSAVLGSIRAEALVAAGFAWEHLGNFARALSAFDEAIQIRPYDAPLVARGLARIRAGAATEGLADLREAVRTGTSLPWPFLFLAREAFEQARWKDAEGLAGEGAARAQPGPLRAQLLGLQAAAATILVRPKVVITGLLQLAHLDNPLDVGVRQTAEALAAWATSNRGSAVPFGDPPDAGAFLRDFSRQMRPEQTVQVD